MKDYGIFSFSSEKKAKILTLLNLYSKKGHLKTLQDRIPYFLTPTPLFKQINRTQTTNLPKKRDLSGVLLIKNPKTKENIRLFVGETPKTTFKSFSTQSFQKNRTPYNFGNFCDYCQTIVLIFSSRISISKQLKCIIRKHFYGKKYKIFITDEIKDPLHIKNKKLDRMKRIIKSTFSSYGMESIGEIKSLPSLEKINKKNWFNKQNSALLTDLFHLIEEPIVISSDKKQRKNLIFKILAIHNKPRVGSTTFFRSQKKIQKKRKIESEEDLPKYKPTIFMDIHSIYRSVKKRNFTFEVFDLSGEKRWHFLSDSFIPIADIIFLFYDMSNPNTLKNLKEWMDILSENYPKKPVVIIGTKKDKIVKKILEKRMKKSNTKNMNNLKNEKFVSREEKLKSDTDLAVQGLSDTWLADYQQVVGHIKTSLFSTIKKRDPFTLALRNLLKDHYIFLEGQKDYQQQMYNLEIENYPILYEIYLRIKSISSYSSKTLINNGAVEKENKKNLEEFLASLKIRHIEKILKNIFKTENPYIFYFGLNVCKLFPKLLNQILDYLFEDFKIFTVSLKKKYALLMVIYDIVSEMGINQMEEQDQRDYISEINKSYLKGLIKTIIDRFSDSPYRGNLEKDIAFEILLYNLIKDLNLIDGDIARFLLLRLIDPIDILREKALDTYLRIYDPESINKNSKNKIGREQLISLLSEKEREFLTEKLQESLKKSNIHVKRHAIYDLGYIHNQKIMKLLLKQIIFCPEELINWVYESITHQDPKRFTEPNLESILDQLTPDEKRFLLSVIESPEGIFHKDSSRRMACINILYKLKDPKTRRILYIGLKDPKESVKLLAVKALRKLGTRESLVPLILSYFVTQSEITKEEILDVALNLLGIKDNIKDGKKTINLAVSHIRKKNTKLLLSKIFEYISSSIITPKKIKYIEALQLFQQERAIKKLVSLIDDECIEIQQTARASLKVIFQNMPFLQFCESTILNLFLQTINKIYHLLQFDLDIETLLGELTWRDVIKGLLYGKIEYSEQLREFLSNWQQINLNLLYNLSDLTYQQIFQKFIKIESLDFRMYNTYLGYLIAAYPSSFKHINLFMRKNMKELSNTQLEKLNELRMRIIRYFRINIENENITSYIIL